MNQGLSPDFPQLQSSVSSLLSFISVFLVRAQSPCCFFFFLMFFFGSPRPTPRSRPSASPELPLAVNLTIMGIGARPPSPSPSLHGLAVRPGRSTHRLEAGLLGRSLARYLPAETPKPPRYPAAIPTLVDTQAKVPVDTRLLKLMPSNTFEFRKPMVILTPSFLSA
jgi:hypothetical protein